MHTCVVGAADGLRQAKPCGQPSRRLGWRSAASAARRVARRLVHAGDHVARDGADVAGLAPLDGPPRHRRARRGGGGRHLASTNPARPLAVDRRHQPFAARRAADDAGAPAERGAADRARARAPEVAPAPRARRRLEVAPAPRARRRRRRRRHRQRARAVALRELRPGACEVIAREVGDVVKRCSRTQPALRRRSAIIRQMRGRWDLGDREERNLARQQVGG